MKGGHLASNATGVCKFPNEQLRSAAEKVQKEENLEDFAAKAQPDGQGINDFDFFTFEQKEGEGVQKLQGWLRGVSLQAVSTKIFRVVL